MFRIHQVPKLKKRFTLCFVLILTLSLPLVCTANEFSPHSFKLRSFIPFRHNHKLAPTVPPIPRYRRRRLAAADEQTDAEQEGEDGNEEGRVDFSENEEKQINIDIPEVVNVQGQSLASLRARISSHQLKLERIKHQMRDLEHERAFLEKTLELKKGQQTMQDGQVRLSQAELEDKAKEIAMYRREAPRTVQRYNELMRQQKHMQETLNRLHMESEQLTSSKTIIMDKMHTLRMEDFIERHARALPDAMAGALRKSAAALIPFFDYLLIAADTNNRLVDHVGAEIDKYTHVNIAKSPFMSGVLFYCVLLIPLLTLISFVRRIFDSSSKLTASHYIIFGNLYFFIMCFFNVLLAMFLGDDPIKILFLRYERPFIVGNLFLAVYYIWHVVMLGIQSVFTLERRNLAQFLATLSVGIHYFIFAWRRIFTDSPPMMYTFNYLVYGTIFCFVLYERYNRMSSKQLKESVILRFMYLTIRGVSHLRTRPLRWETISIFLHELWTSWNKPLWGSDRYSLYGRGRKQNSRRRHPKSFSQNGKEYAEQTSDSNEDEENFTEADPFLSRDSRRSIAHRIRSKKQDQKSNHQSDRRSFINMFFGSRDNVDEDETTEEEEEEEIQTNSGWRILPRLGNSSKQTASTNMRYESRSSNAHDNTHHEDRNRSRSNGKSLWKWL